MNDDFNELFRQLESKLEAYHVKATGKKPVAPISDDQRKKVYAMVRKLADHTGESVDEMKSILKRQFCKDNKLSEFSLSSCTRALAHNFIDFILLEMVSSGVEFSPEDIMFYEKTVKYILHQVLAKKCIVCGKDARESKYNMRPFTLCDAHIPEWKKDKEAFIKKYCFRDYFHGIGA